MKENLREIASHFALEGPVTAIDSLGEGFINDTFIVRTEADAPDYILQRKNKAVFPDVPAMMDNIRRVTEHIRRRVICGRRRPAARGDDRRPGKGRALVPRRRGRRILGRDGLHRRHGCLQQGRLPGTGPQRAAKASGNSSPSWTISPNRWRRRSKGSITSATVSGQWDAALARDAAGRRIHLAEEIGWIESRRAEMLSFWSKVEDGTIPTRVTHNDTKINNILFDKQGEVLCAIDLDTVMASTSLNDFGDAIRSYANTGDEDDRDLSRVGISLEMFSAYTDGYLSQRAAQLTDTEIGHLAFSARYITFEQVLRFLMDYIDGDTYYKIKYPDHNLVRTHAQYRLLQSMEEHYGEMCRIVDGIAAKYRNA